MLTLTKKADYALIALAHLAKHPEGLTSARAIAEQYRLPLPILTNVMKDLASSGLVLSERGARGGYALAQPAEEVTLLALLTAIEGPLQLVRCAEPSAISGGCRLESRCPIRYPAQRIHSRLVGFLANVSLADLLGDNFEDIEFADLAPAVAPPSEVPLGETDP